VNADRGNLTEYQQRLVDYYIHEARMNGTEALGGNRKNFMEVYHQLVEDKDLFQ